MCRLSFWLIIVIIRRKPTHSSNIFLDLSVNIREEVFEESPRGCICLIPQYNLFSLYRKASHWSDHFIGSQPQSTYNYFRKNHKAPWAASRRKWNSQQLWTREARYAQQPAWTLKIAMKTRDSNFPNAFVQGRCCISACSTGSRKGALNVATQRQSNKNTSKAEGRMSMWPFIPRNCSRQVNRFQVKRNRRWSLGDHRLWKSAAAHSGLDNIPSMFFHEFSLSNAGTYSEPNP